MALGRIWDVLFAFPPLLLAIVIVATFVAGFLDRRHRDLDHLRPAARPGRPERRPRREAEGIRRGMRACTASAPSASPSRHVLPTAIPTIVAQSTLNFGYALLDLAGLAFLGLGVQPPTADWGVMLSDGRKVILLSPSEVLAAAIAIAVTVVAFNLLGDALTHRRAER